MSNLEIDYISATKPNLEKCKNIFTQTLKFTKIKLDQFCFWDWDIPIFAYFVDHANLRSIIPNFSAFYIPLHDQDCMWRLFGLTLVSLESLLMISVIWNVKYILYNWFSPRLKHLKFWHHMSALPLHCGCHEAMDVHPLLPFLRTKASLSLSLPMHGYNPPNFCLTPSWWFNPNSVVIMTNLNKMAKMDWYGHKHGQYWCLYEEQEKCI